MQLIKSFAFTHSRTNLWGLAVGAVSELGDGVCLVLAITWCMARKRLEALLAITQLVSAGCGPLAQRSLTAVTDEVCDGASSASSLCGAYADIVLAVQASNANINADAEINSIMDAFIDAFEFAQDSDGSAAAWSPRVALLMCSYVVPLAGDQYDASQVIANLTANATDLKAAVANRSASSESTCHSCCLSAAQQHLVSTGRTGARRRVFLLASAYQSVLGGGFPAVAQAATLEESGTSITLLQYEADCAPGCSLTSLEQNKLASTPLNLFNFGSATTSVSALLSSNITSAVRSSCTQVDYVCVNGASLLCEQDADVIAHGKGFYDKSDGSLLCKVGRDHKQRHNAEHTAHSRTTLTAAYGHDARRAPSAMRVTCSTRFRDS